MASHYMHAPSFVAHSPPFNTPYREQPYHGQPHLPPPPGYAHPPLTTLGPGVQVATGLGLHYQPRYCDQFQRDCRVTDSGPRHSLGYASHGHESGWGAHNQRPSLPSFATLVASLEPPPESFAQTRQPSFISSASTPPSADPNAAVVSYQYAAPVHHHHVNANHPLTRFNPGVQTAPAQQPTTSHRHVDANHYPARSHAHNVQTAPAPQASSSHVRAGDHGKTRSSTAYRRKYRPPKTDQKRRPKLPMGSRFGETWSCPAGVYCGAHFKGPDSLKRHLGIVGRTRGSACRFFKRSDTNRKIWASCVNIEDLAPFKVIADNFPPLPGDEA